jgi:hypothetical protein
MPDPEIEEDSEEEEDDDQEEQHDETELAMLRELLAERQVSFSS